jgi:hypothetical protein
MARYQQLDTVQLVQVKVVAQLQCDLNVLLVEQGRGCVWQADVSRLDMLAVLGPGGLRYARNLDLGGVLGGGHRRG